MLYTPPSFRESRPEILHAAMRAHPLAHLVSAVDGEVIATPVPLLLDTEGTPRLIGHLARANPYAKARPGRALAIFSGPDAYVTPSWYASKRAHGKVVPTWNYVVVHVRGTLTWLDDAAAIRGVVEALTRAHEERRAEPWAVSDAPADFIAAQLEVIVGFTLSLETVEGKWKMSQNRPAADRAGVIAGLSAEGKEEIASLIPPPEPPARP
jgi:transcriptional regulator